MQYRSVDEGGDLFSILEHQQKQSTRSLGINKLNKVINWEDFRPALESLLGYDKRDESKGGRPPFEPVFMFKVLVLQRFHGLSDEATEVQISDRFSFLEFLGLRPGDSVPDQNTIWDFREALEKDGRSGTRRLFECFEQKLNEEGLIGREGSIVDASFVDAPRQRNTRAENKSIKQGSRPDGFEQDTAKGRQKDCEARWAVKNKETHYGYKNHLKVDAKSKLIIGFATTPANVHDSQVFTELVDENDHAVFADSAYLSDANEAHILDKCNAQDFVILKAQRNKPLCDEDKVTNKLRSRIRVRVEHVFGRITQMAMDRLNTIGSKRAQQHNAMSNLVYNMDRYALLAR